MSKWINVILSADGVGKCGCGSTEELFRAWDGVSQFIQCFGCWLSYGDKFRRGGDNTSNYKMEDKFYYDRQNILSGISPMRSAEFTGIDPINEDVRVWCEYPLYGSEYEY